MSDESVSPPEPQPAPPPAPLETFTPEPEPVAPAVVEEPAADLPEVETSVGYDQGSGKYLVSVIIRHPDTTVIAVNGRAVWEGNG